MKDPLFQKIYTSYKRLLPDGGKLLLAVSGGVDSMAMFHLTLEACQMLPLSIEVIHINHGWRIESEEEARILAEWIGSIPFHYRKVDEPLPEVGIEAFLREKRYAFFREVFDSGTFDAVAVAHQADDQAETVLKRLFEGSSLPNLAGLREDRQLFGMRVVRPLLHCYRHELETYLVDRGYSHLEDPTNADVAFTRARTRHVIIPHLEKLFGKNIKGNLNALAEDALMLEEHIPVVNEGGMRKVPLTSIDTKRKQLSVFANLFPYLSRDEKKTLGELVLHKKTGKRVRDIVVQKAHIEWKVRDKF